MKINKDDIHIMLANKVSFEIQTTLMRKFEKCSVIVIEVQFDLELFDWFEIV
jgi:hypothetical protein